MDKKKNKFSWKKKDEKENNSKLMPEKNDIKGEDDFMQFSNGASVLNESNNTGHESATQSENASNPASASFLPKKAESYISKDVIINGSITAASNIVIDGKVIGDVTTDKDITVFGNIEGNLSANIVKLSGAKITGNITCKSNINFAKDSIVDGNVSCESVEMNATIHGNLKVVQGAVIMGSAVINGDISAASISVVEGAELNGNVHVTKSESPSAAIAQVAAAAAGDKGAAAGDKGTVAGDKGTAAGDKGAAAAAPAKAGGSDILRRYI
jgi:cytoskeletal protein CcmA (bactofilin family)